MKKFLKVFLLCMAVLTVLTAAVSAAEPDVLYADGDPTRKTNTITYTYEGEETDIVWLSSNNGVVTVVENADGAGVVTAVAPGEASIMVMKADYSAKLAEWEVKVVNRKLDSIEVSGNFKTTYNSGESFDRSGMVVTKVYDNGDRATTTTYEVTPAELTAKTAAVTIKVTENGISKTKDITVNVNEISVTKVELELAKTELKVGDGLPEMTVTVTYSDNSKATLSSGYDIYLDGTKVSSTRKLTETDNNKKIKVYYRSEYSNEVKITVTDEPDFTPSFRINGSFTKKNYVVGDRLDWTGVTSLVIIKNGETVQTLSSSYLQSLSSSDPLNKLFTTGDVGKSTFVLNHVYNGETYPIAITGLTVSNSLGLLDPYSITDMILSEDSYPTGYSFDIDDIYYIRYTESRNGSKIRLTGSELALYADTMSLEVLTDNGTRKPNSRRNYRSIIEEDDIFTEDGEKLVNVRLYIGTLYFDTTVVVEEASVSVHYEGEVLGVYDNIDEAIDAVAEMDSAKYPISGKVVTIKLGEDQRVSSRTSIEINRYIEIDMNGYDLEFYSDTVSTNIPSFFTLTIVNTAKEESTFSYYDEDIDLVLAEDESFSFARGYEDEDNLPGVYTVTLDIGKNGSVTASPKADKNDEIAVGHGSKVTLTITPNKNYIVDEVAIGRTKFDESDEGYTKKNGVVTFVVTITDDCTISVDFVAGEEEPEEDPKEEWENPFVDVSTSSTYYSAVAFVNQNGLFQGTTATRFSPSSTMTRAMFVTVLGRLAGLDEDTAAMRYGYESEFADVDKSNGRISYAIPYIAWATQYGLIEGYGNGNFGPENPITHQQMYVIMKRYASFVANLPTSSSSGVILSFTDKAQIADWALDAVKYAKQQDFIVTTSSNKISPTTNATRAELAQLIQKFASNVLEWNIDEK